MKLLQKIKIKKKNERELWITFYLFFFEGELSQSFVL